MMDITTRLWIAHSELPDRQLLMRDAIMEIKSLRDENANLHAACKIADRRNEELREALAATNGMLEAHFGAVNTDDEIEQAEKNRALLLNTESEP